jgi:hypothetical protein
VSKEIWSIPIYFLHIYLLHSNLLKHVGRKEVQIAHPKPWQVNHVQPIENIINASTVNEEKKALPFF